MRLMDIQNLEYQVRIEQMENRIEYLEVLNSRSDAQKENIDSKISDIPANDQSCDTPPSESMQTDQTLGDSLKCYNDDAILDAEAQKAIRSTSGISVFVETQRKVGLRLASESGAAIEEPLECHPQGSQGMFCVYLCVCFYGP